MKIARFFGCLFGILGTILLVGSIGLCLFSLNAPVRMEKAPEGALACSEQLADAVSQKDYAALEKCLYGQPKLGMEKIEGSPVWELYEQTLSFSWQGGCYAKDAGIFREGTVTYLDIASVTENLSSRTHALMTRRVEAATEMEELYDETGEFREDLVNQVLQEALEECIHQDARETTKTVTVELVCRDGQWFAVPESALMDALSGGLK